MLKKLISLVVSLGIICSLIVLPTGTAYASDFYGCGDYNAEDGCVYISNAQQLVTLSEVTKTTGHPALGAHFVLANDITIPAIYDNQINIASDSSNPFYGVFDGNGHTITGLKHSTYAADSGLFAFTDEATIKNLVLEQADIQTVHRGGFIVGHAENTKFLNISVRNSKMRIISGGVAIALLTADGATLGGIAGEAIEGSLMYNCETVDVFMDTGEAEGISALEGDGYFIGGLVGTLNNSHIEYCRTISKTESDSGRIEADLVVAVAAASFKNIYVGGIVGEMNYVSSVLDSFSNIALYSDPATGLTVVGAVYGYLGGIAGITWGKECKIERCHYSGTAYQKDFGGVGVVAPVDNTHRGGVIGCINEYHTWDVWPYNLSSDGVGGTFNNIHYNYDRVMEATGDGAKYDDECGVAYEYVTLGRYRATAHLNNTCTSISNNSYGDQSIWEQSTFDFNGSTLRSTPCNVLFEDNGNNGQHVNQWIMYTYNYSNTGDTAYSTTTMPIHGTTTMEIYSNYHNAFTDEDADSMTYEYTINADQTVTVPKLSAVESLVEEENTKYAGYIGLAFVSRNTTQQGTSYNCDYIYAENDETITNTVPLNIIQTYSSDPDKRIYAVWCQGKTIGGQLNLSGSSGIRVLTAVNTALLENIALDKPDDEYRRAVTFNDEATTAYLIKADSRVWHGEQYVEAAGAAKDDIPNAQVFSIYLSLDENDYNTEINAVGDILLNDSSAEGKFIDYICGGSFTRSAKQIAEAYFNDLMAGDYQISDDAYINLINYIPEIANEEIDMSSDMDFDQFDDAMPEAEAQAE